MVKIDKQDYDDETPLFLAKLNMAMNVRYELEKKAADEARG
jgi:hypothetical protein